jgi:7-keto-8-aminopelargonate synthetase-like enzyme
VKTLEERLALLDRMLTEPADRGLLLQTVDDEPLNGRTISLSGKERLNFGSCSYLGLEMDERMRRAVCDAVMRYGTQFSSSRSYISAPLYTQVEERLSEMFGGHVLVAPSTTLGHLAAIPVLAGENDAILLDQQVHHSVHLAVNQARTQGSTVDVLRHDDLDALEEAIERAIAAGHPKVWYMTDGVYSMFAERPPLDDLRRLLDTYEQLHLYIDDSHGVSWTGKHGRGPTLDAMGGHPRLIVTGSLNKSFAAAGGALVFPDAELKRRVRTIGGPMIFSGPVQPPMLGAALCSAEIHLSDEIVERQQQLMERIELCTRLMEEFDLPLIAHDPAPIRYVVLGLPRVAEQVVERMLDDGFYTNLAIFPAVPMRQCGVRVTLTLHHTLQDIRDLVEALARHVPVALAAERARTSTTLRLDRASTVDDLDAEEWDARLESRGTFGTDGLRFLEQAFSRGDRPEDEWEFRYYVVRDQANRPVAATFFTLSLWKDDTLSPERVSEIVEERRVDDPYWLTSRTFAMGSLFTEGDHLWLDRAGDWEGALDQLLTAVAEDAREFDAKTIVLRDLDSGDRDLAAALRHRGFVEVAMPETLIVDPVIGNDEEWLAGLSAKSRYHQRREVLPYDDTFDVEFLRKGGREVSDDELRHLYWLYRNVWQRRLDLNTFSLPETLFTDMLDHDRWELMLLRLREDPDAPPVAIGAHFRGEHHYAPMLVGLDYEYVYSHHSYRQALRQALLRARALGAKSVPWGMGATLEKRRFGAKPVARSAFVQTSDHYALEVLASLQADVASDRVGQAARRRNRPVPVAR